jgi:ATP/maltotriose-dependent transcriptional regulator MalT
MLLSIAWGDAGQAQAALGERELALDLFDQATEAQRSLELKIYRCQYLQQKAELMFCGGDTVAATAVNDEARAVGREIGRHDVVFDADLLATRILALINTAGAVTALRAMLGPEREPHQIAAIHYELYRHGGLAGEGREAERRYRELCERTPNILYKQRAKELHGKTAR